MASYDATACILAGIVYILFDCNWVSEKKNTIKASFIDNSNNYIIALKIAYAVTKELTHIGELTNTESKKITLIITNAVSLKQQGHKPYIIC